MSEQTMNENAEGIRQVELAFGGGKDNLISLATMVSDASGARPAVRTVDALYEGGAFYAVTHAQSGKMRQIAVNPAVSVCGHEEMFTAQGVGENLGWVLRPENADIRAKLRKTFAAWYDMANNESDENCCILKIRLCKGTMIINHWEKVYAVDFEARA